MPHLVVDEARAPGPDALLAGLPLTSVPASSRGVPAAMGISPWLKTVP